MQSSEEGHCKKNHNYDILLLYMIDDAGSFLNILSGAFDSNAFIKLQFSVLYCCH